MNLNSSPVTVIPLGRTIGDSLISVGNELGSGAKGMVTTGGAGGVEVSAAAAGALTLVVVVGTIVVMVTVPVGLEVLVTTDPPWVEIPSTVWLKPLLAELAEV